MQVLRLFYLIDSWVAFDGVSICDGDPDLRTLVNRLVGWVYDRDEGEAGYVFVRQDGSNQ